MTILPLLRCSLLAAALGSALSAHAFAISFDSTGVLASGDLTSTTIQSNETKINSENTGGLAPLPAGQFLVFQTFIRQINYYDMSVTPRQELDTNLLVTNDTNDGTVRSLSGTWTYASGQGQYAGADKATSLGTWTFSFNPTTKVTHTTLSGNLGLAAVPEPSALAALGLGALAFVRRRRK